MEELARAAHLRCGYNLLKSGIRAKFRAAANDKIADAEILGAKAQMSGGTCALPALPAVQAPDALMAIAPPAIATPSPKPNYAIGRVAGLAGTMDARTGELGRQLDDRMGPGGQLNDGVLGVGLGAAGINRRQLLNDRLNNRVGLGLTSRQLLNDRLNNRVGLGGGQLNNRVLGGVGLNRRQLLDRVGLGGGVGLNRRQLMNDRLNNRMGLGGLGLNRRQLMNDRLNNRVGLGGLGLNRRQLMNDRLNNRVGLGLDRRQLMNDRLNNRVGLGGLGLGGLGLNRRQLMNDRLNNRVGLGGLGLNRRQLLNDRVGLGGGLGLDRRQLLNERLNNRVGLGGGLGLNRRQLLNDRLNNRVGGGLGLNRRLMNDRVGIGGGLGRRFTDDRLVDNRFVNQGIGPQRVFERDFQGPQPSRFAMEDQEDGRQMRANERERRAQNQANRNEERREARRMQQQQYTEGLAPRPQAENQNNTVGNTASVRPTRPTSSQPQVPQAQAVPKPLSKDQLRKQKNANRESKKAQVFNEFKNDLLTLRDEDESTYRQASKDLLRKYATSLGADFVKRQIDGVTGWRRKRVASGNSEYARFSGLLMNPNLTDAQFQEKAAEFRKLYVKKYGSARIEKLIQAAEARRQQKKPEGTSATLAANIATIQNAKDLDELKKIGARLMGKYKNNPKMADRVREALKTRGRMLKGKTGTPTSLDQPASSITANISANIALIQSIRDKERLDKISGKLIAKYASNPAQVAKIREALKTRGRELKLLKPRNESGASNAQQKFRNELKIIASERDDAIFESKVSSLASKYSGKIPDVQRKIDSVRAWRKTRKDASQLAAKNSGFSKLAAALRNPGMSDSQFEAKASEFRRAYAEKYGKQRIEKIVRDAQMRRRSGRNPGADLARRLDPKNREKLMAAAKNKRAFGQTYGQLRAKYASSPRAMQNLAAAAQGPIAAFKQAKSPAAAQTSPAAQALRLDPKNRQRLLAAAKDRKAFGRAYGGLRAKYASSPRAMQNLAAAAQGPIAAFKQAKSPAAAQTSPAQTSPVQALRLDPRNRQRLLAAAKDKKAFGQAYGQLRAKYASSPRAMQNLAAAAQGPIAAFKQAKSPAAQALRLDPRNRQRLLAAAKDRKAFGQAYGQLRAKYKASPLAMRNLQSAAAGPIAAFKQAKSPETQAVRLSGQNRQRLLAAAKQGPKAFGQSRGQLMSKYKQSPAALRNIQSAAAAPQARFKETRTAAFKDARLDPANARRLQIAAGQGSKPFGQTYGQLKGKYAGKPLAQKNLEAAAAGPRARFKTERAQAQAKQAQTQAQTQQARTQAKRKQVSVQTQRAQMKRRKNASQRPRRPTAPPARGRGTQKRTSPQTQKR